MPIYQLIDQLVFPPVDGSEDGIVAVGGDLSVERLLLAYRLGIFPWFSEGEPIVWHAPDVRFVLDFDELHISKSMRRVLNNPKFTVTLDTQFKQVIQYCANVKRKFQNGTWITPEMQSAYLELHQLGYAHSLEVWYEKKLVGGIYGVSLGKVFFAESMFHLQTNASKIAFIRLVQFLKQHHFHFLDAQVYTEHVESLGAKEIPRNEFMHKLNIALQSDALLGKWTEK